jgi:hypothetical protein
MFLNPCTYYEYQVSIDFEVGGLALFNYEEVFSIVPLHWFNILCWNFMFSENEEWQEKKRNMADYKRDFV